MRKINKKNKPTYKGPYPNNPNIVVDKVRKSMRIETDGPTVDAFSTLDTTTDINATQKEITGAYQKKRRPTKKKLDFELFSEKKILWAVIGSVAIGVGIIVYDHGNKFVSVEKDIDYLKDDLKEKKEQIDKVLGQTNSIDKKLDLLNQKFDLKSYKK